MIYILRTMFAFVAGFMAAFAMVIAVEFLSSILHPLPSDFGQTQDEICLHVANYPAWVLGLVVVAWGLTAFIGTWIARRIGNIYSASSLGLLLFGLVGLNVSMLPYPIWFKVVILLAIPVACLCGTGLATTIHLNAREENRRGRD